MFPPAGSDDGALLPFADHKGYALAMVCEVLGAALTGGDTTRPETATMQHGVWNNMLAIVFDPLRLNSSAAFGAEVQAFVEWVQSSALRPGAQEIMMPGDPERAARRARAAAITIDGETLAELDQAARVGGGGDGPAACGALAAHHDWSEPRRSEPRWRQLRATTAANPTAPCLRGGAGVPAWLDSAEAFAASASPEFPCATDPRSFRVLSCC